MIVSPAGDARAEHTLSKRKVQGKSSGGRPKKSKEAELPLESNDEPVPEHESALG